MMAGGFTRTLRLRLLRPAITHAGCFGSCASPPSSVRTLIPSRELESLRSPFSDGSRRVPVPLPAGIKDRLRWWGPSHTLWAGYRRGRALREYERRREHYALEAEQRGLVYSEANVTREIRQRLVARGYTPNVRRVGEIHTFACIPQYSWHHHLL